MTSSSTFLDTAQSLASQWLAFNDHTRLYRLQWGGAQEAGDDAPTGWNQLLLHSWAMREGLGQVGEIQLQALTRQADLEPQQLLASSFIIWTRLADGSEYPRSGIVTDVRSLGSDGGFARWHITLQSWLGLLALQRRSQVWQEQSVEAIIDSVLAHYSAVAAPAAAGDKEATGSGWSWSSCARERLQQSHQGGLRSYIIQYRETDLAFFERLLAEEHLTWRLQTDAHDPARQHLLILADSSDPQSCPADATSQRHGGIRYHGQGSQQEEDAVQQLHALRQLHTADLASVSWDYRAKHSQRHESQSTQPIGCAQAPRWQQHIHLADWRHSGQADGEHHLRHIQTALDAERKRYACESTVRTLGAGRRFALRQSTLHDWAAAALRQLSEEARDGNPANANAAPELLPIEVIHAGLNNLPDQTPEQRRQSLRWLPQWVHASTRERTVQLGYANQFQALRVQQPWLPLFRKADGQVLPGNAPERPRPGLLRATVTDEQGAGIPGELHLDALGRIRIRFDFQETAQQTDSAADNTSQSSCWVRVLQRISGAGWGGQFIPRIGQEVLVDFVGGDIHRPLVIGSLYNGQGEGAQAPTPGGKEAAQHDEAPFTTSHDHRSSEQGNRVANGHSPAWHAAAPAAAMPGNSGHSNPDALSGYKSAQYPQAHAGGAHNQLVFDDSNQQLRVQLATSQATSQLNLGHLVHQADNHRGSFRGYGFELRSDAWGALRGGQGVLLSTYASQAQEPAADNTGGIALARQLQQLAQVSSDMSQTHQSPGLASERGTQRPAHSEQRDSQAAIAAHLRSIKGMVSSASVESAQADAENYNIQTTPDASQAPRLPANASALVQIASADGLLAVAGHSQHLGASEHIVQASAEHLQIASGGHTRIHSGQAIGVLAGILQQDRAAASPAPASAAPGTDNTGQPNAPQPGPLAAQSATGTGLSLIAAQGPFILQAQNGRMHIAAKADVDIRSAANLNWSAAKYIKLKTVGGACITIDGGQIEVKCPGTITIHASQRQFVGPATVSQQMNSWPQSKFDDPYVVRNPATGQPIANCWVEIERADGSKLKVKTDAQGKTPVQRSEFVEGITLRVLD